MKGFSNQESYVLYLSIIVASEFLEISGNCGKMTSAIFSLSFSFTNCIPLLSAFVNLVNSSSFSSK